MSIRRCLPLFTAFGLCTAGCAASTRGDIVQAFAKEGAGKPERYAFEPSKTALKLGPYSMISPPDLEKGVTGFLLDDGTAPGWTAAGKGVGETRNGRAYLTESITFRRGQTASTAWTLELSPTLMFQLGGKAKGAGGEELSVETMYEDRLPTGECYGVANAYVLKNGKVVGAISLFKPSPNGEVLLSDQLAPTEKSLVASILSMLWISRDTLDAVGRAPGETPDGMDSVVRAARAKLRTAP